MLRLGSVIEYGFGPNTGGISLIYSYLLEKYGMNINYSILINHIGSDLQEQIILISKGQVGINIRYDIPKDFNTFSSNEKNILFTEIIHEALLRLAGDKAEIDVSKLRAIKAEIISKNFSFDIPYKKFSFKNTSRVASINIQPELLRFNFFVSISENDIEKCKLLIYSGKTTDFYISDLFSYGKWKGANHFVLSGKRSEIEIHISIDGCKMEFVNTKSDKDKAPVFELFKADADKEKTLKEYINSLNPAIAAILTQSQN